MELTLVKIIVNSESDFSEEGVDKVLADISIIAELSGNGNKAQVVIETQAISLNSDTGVKMDEDRLAHCTNLLNNFQQ